MATLIAPSNHSPQEDAEALRKAFEGGLSHHHHDPLCCLDHTYS